jgi:hypothetical protein
VAPRRATNQKKQLKNTGDPGILPAYRWFLVSGWHERVGTGAERPAAEYTNGTQRPAANVVTTVTTVERAI